ncbi:hypothetical protein [Roseivirga sp. 4D4]|uniref:hypothetical protein n=1 Tax=Roseivirga sp. 4D4 TaxID=1889784 RepID=UPI001112E6C0|nr:hypothetical protein [Roseivirga sp. 4D4]
MKRNVNFLIILMLIAIAFSCENEPLSDIDDTDITESFDFHISSEDLTGIIELPEAIKGSEVVNIEVLNDPTGEYEVLTQTFSSLLERGENYHYIVYTAPDLSPESDELIIELKTSDGEKTQVLAKPVVLDHSCSGPSNYNFAIKNFSFDVKAGDVIEVPAVQARYSLSGGQFSSIPCESVIEESNTNPIPNRRSELRLYPIGENLITIPDGRCCTFLGPGHSPNIDIKRYNADGTEQISSSSNPNAPATPFNWIFTIPEGKTGTFRFLKREVTWKTEVEGSLTGLSGQRLPNYTPEWYSRTQFHSYSIITFHVNN